MNALLLLLASSATLKIEVEGDGYLRFTSEGRTVFARTATLEVRDGFISATSGERLLPSIAVSGTPTQIEVDESGRITVTTSQTEFKAGRIRLAKFPAGDVPQRSGAFYLSRSKGELGFPGENGYGTIRSVADSRSSIGAPSVKAKAQKVRIVIKPKSTVSGTAFTLGEIAEVEAPDSLIHQLRDVEIGDSPGIGVERGIDRTRVLGRLRMAKLDPDAYEVTVPNGAVVTRKSQNLPHGQVAEVARRSAVLEVGTEVLLTEEGKPTDIQIPPGTLELATESVAATREKVRVIVGIFVDGKRFNSRTIVFDKPAAIPGVKVGEVVRIRVRSGDAIVESRGKAVSSAFVGERVAVKSETGAELTGKVVEPGVVEVNP